MEGRRATRRPFFTASTMTTAHSPLPSPRGVVLTLSPAFAASLLVHAAIVIALLSWVSLGDRSASADPLALAVRLVGEPQPAPPVPVAVSAPEQAAAERPDEGAALAIASVAPVEASRITPAQPAASAVLVPPPPAMASAPPASAVPLGSVDVRLQNQSLLTGLPNDLANRTTTEFPVEVARLVRMPSKPVVAYPPEALKAQRQGSVLAWVTVEANGDVEEIIIVDGDLEFANAVETALAGTRFEPAADRSGPIRFYTMLRFDFAGGSPGAAAATATVAGTESAIRASPP